MKAASIEKASRQLQCFLDVSAGRSPDDQAEAARQWKATVGLEGDEAFDAFIHELARFFPRPDDEDGDRRNLEYTFMATLGAGIALAAAGSDT